MKNTSYDRCLLALSNKLRMDIVTELSAGPKSVDALAKSLKVEQSRLSHALKPLRECGFVKSKRSGKERIYSLCRYLDEGVTVKGRTTIFEFIDKHIENFCRGKCRRDTK